MNKHEFLHKFHLHPLTAAVSSPPLGTGGVIKESAVLVALVEINNALHVVLTKRASHLKHHPGQISFPGGKVEKHDSNIFATALREAQEEIGLAADSVAILGQLPEYRTLTGFTITPVIALLPQSQHYVIDQNEVAQVFHVPLQHFIDQRNHIIITVERKMRQHPIYYMPYNEHNIWGATAAILKDLCENLR
ncbi:CoA pyrophosphatase [Thalassotalea hakodatensis]|uniref:CoA pyrophosphatase n=1 Tax=Thalassotalea hakodatensis TaxID=3030492 RepID=UPI0025734A9D|nr:CoA pyrophosphatase [Thalassotalea hakodatensis]